MEQQQLPLNQVIDMALQPGAEVLHANLARLSALGAEALSYFEKQWKKTGAEQRLRLLSAMVSLSEDDLALDFTAIFKLGIEDCEENIRIKALDGLELEDKHTFVRPFIKALRNDESVAVRTTAARALGKFALMAEMEELPDVVGQDLFNALLEVLENAESPLELRRRALESIAPFQQELIEQYIEDYYYHDDPKVKASAIYAMGRNCNPRWLRFVIDEMQNSDSEIRFEAARASGELEDEEAISPLLRLLNDEDAEVQEAAITALGKIGGQDAKKALQQLIHSADPRIKSAAGSALAELQSCEDPLSLNF
jgi:HEAT repeat protein